MSKARIVLPIEGMSCASCAATVQEALTGATGVGAATVNYATAKAAVDYDDAQTGVAELIKTVRAAGYDCGSASVTFGVEQLHYAPSVAPLEQVLGRVKGVVRAAANQATETVTVAYVPGAARAHPPREGVVGPAVLPRRLGWLPAPHGGHEHAHRGRHRRGVPVRARRDARARRVHTGGVASRRVLRGRVRDHRAHPARPAARGASQGAHVAGDPAHGGPQGANGARGAGRRGNRARGGGGGRGLPGDCEV